MAGSVVFPSLTVGSYFQPLPGGKHTSGIISSDYPMPSTHRAVVPSNARQQACIGSCFKRLLGNKHASGHVFSDYPKNVAVGCENAFLSTVVGTFHDPSGSISYPQGHFGHFFVHYSWVSIARGIEPEMPLIARRSAHFVTRRLISLPVGSFRYPQGYFGLFSEHYPGHVFALGIEAKVPSTCRLVMPGQCQGSRHGWPWLGKEGDHPPLYMHLWLFPMWQEETSFRPRSVLAIFLKN